MKVAVLIKEPVKQALKQTISLFGEIEFVEDAYKANVVIADDAIMLAPYYCKEREFIVFSDHPRGDQEAKNVHEYGILQSLEVMTFPAIRAQKGLPENLPGPAETVVKRIEKPGAKKVLVIDDTARHQKSAVTLLGDYDLTVADGYDEAMQLLAKNEYEVVLTDMEMPMSTKLSAYILGKLIPYGLLIEKEATMRGVRYVAVVTDLNHHTDPFSAAFDHFADHEYIENGAKVKYMHAPMTTMGGESAKDWKVALERLIQ